MNVPTGRAVWGMWPYLKGWGWRTGLRPPMFRICFFFLALQKWLLLPLSSTIWLKHLHCCPNWPLSLRFRWTAESCPGLLALRVLVERLFSRLVHWTNLCLRLLSRLEMSRTVMLVKISQSFLERTIGGLQWLKEPAVFPKCRPLNCSLLCVFSLVLHCLWLGCDSMYPKGGQLAGFFQITLTDLTWALSFSTDLSGPLRHLDSKHRDRHHPLCGCLCASFI